MKCIMERETAKKRQNYLANRIWKKRGISVQIFIPVRRVHIVRRLWYMARMERNLVSVRWAGCGIPVPAAPVRCG